MYISVRTRNLSLSLQNSHQKYYTSNNIYPENNNTTRFETSTYPLLNFKRIKLIIIIIMHIKWQ